ncbi:GH116 family glycosyl-hydrolase [Bacteroidota bacterium]
MPRFSTAKFNVRFPFGMIELYDENIPLEVSVTGWSPFIPIDEDNSSLPVAGIEYTFSNSSGQQQDGVFSFNTENFMKVNIPQESGSSNQVNNSILPFPDGVLLWQEGNVDPRHEGGFGISIPDEEVIVDHCWFRGGWFDPLSLIWKKIDNQDTSPVEPVESGAPGASIFVPFSLEPGKSKTIKVLLSWHVPFSELRRGSEPDETVNEDAVCCNPETYKPWYSGKFRTAKEVGEYWNSNYDKLRDQSKLFSETFYDSSLPDEVLEAISANLTILKSPTVLRQQDGRM